MKKYIVNDIANQIFDGSLTTAQGSIDVNDGTYRTGVYRALLTHVESSTASSIYELPGKASGPGLPSGLIVGEEYTISYYNGTDDFTNVGAYTNLQGTSFTATGEIPAAWDGSVLESSGNFVVEVLENTMGHEIFIDNVADGIYVGFGPYGAINNQFPRRNTSLISGKNFSSQPLPSSTSISAGALSLLYKDDSFILLTLDDNVGAVSYSLYQTPIELRVRQNVSGETFSVACIVPELPIEEVIASIYSGSNYVDTFSTFSGPVANKEDLVVLLNTQLAPAAGYWGTFSLDGSNNVVLTASARIKEQWSRDAEMTIVIDGIPY